MGVSAGRCLFPPVFFCRIAAHPLRYLIFRHGAQPGASEIYRDLQAMARPRVFLAQFQSTGLSARDADSATISNN